MKVINWRRKIIAAVAAAGIYVPSAVLAVNIPVLDQDFETYSVPSWNYAYATGPLGAYRPASPWVDDLGHNSGNYIEDNASSNYLYNTTYANAYGRGTPRSGSQAMHGFQRYSAQVHQTATFEAGKTYLLSVWAQNDVANTFTKGVFAYLFNGNQTFDDSTALSKALFTSINGRISGMTSAESQMNWTKVTIKHSVGTGAPEAGAPIGMGFFIRRGTAIDDVSLESDDAANHVLVLEVNTTNGQARVRNQTPAPIKIDYYDIASSNGALNAIAWNSLQEQNMVGFPAGNGSGNGWEQAGGSGPTAIGESYLTGNSSITNGTNVNLGALHNVGGSQDLTFRYGAVLSAPQNPTGDYNNDGKVDGADYVVWRNNLGQNVVLPNDSTSGSVTDVDYTVWREHFGDTATTPPSTKFWGVVRYVPAFTGSALGGGATVPEPASVILAGIGLAGGFALGRNPRRSSE